MTVKQLKQGDFFTLKPIESPKESQVYIRGDYDVGMVKAAIIGGLHLKQNPAENGIL